MQREGQPPSVIARSLQGLFDEWQRCLVTLSSESFDRDRDDVPIGGRQRADEQRACSRVPGRRPESPSRLHPFVVGSERALRAPFDELRRVLMIGPPRKRTASSAVVTTSRQTAESSGRRRNSAAARR